MVVRTAIFSGGMRDQIARDAILNSGRDDRATAWQAGPGAVETRQASPSRLPSP